MTGIKFSHEYLFTKLVAKGNKVEESGRKVSLSIYGTKDLPVLWYLPEYCLFLSCFTS